MTDAAADLEALGIDSAELRVLAARDYIAEQSVIVTRQFNAVWLIATFLDHCEMNAFKRGEVPCCTTEPEFGCTCLPEEPRCFRYWSPKLITADYLTARSVVLKPYSGKARDRAIEILDEYVPPALRVSDKHRVRA